MGGTHTGLPTFTGDATAVAVPATCGYCTHAPHPGVVCEGNALDLPLRCMCGHREKVRRDRSE